MKIKLIDVISNKCRHDAGPRDPAAGAHKIERALPDVGHEPGLSLVTTARDICTHTQPLPFQPPLNRKTFAIGTPLCNKQQRRLSNSKKNERKKVTTIIIIIPTSHIFFFFLLYFFLFFFYYFSFRDSL